MMGHYRIVIVCLFVALVRPGLPVQAQYALEDFSLNGDLHTWYDSAVSLENTVLLNGKLFTFTRKSPNSHAFFEENAWREVDLVYFGQTFHGVPALYHIEEDQLIIKNPLSVTNPIELIKEEVSAFTIGETHFERIAEGVGFRSNGFYQIAYRGDSLSLIYKIYKKLSIKSGVLTYEVNYDPWLKIGDTYKQIIRFTQVKRLFPTHKKDLKQFKQQLGLKGRLDNREKQKAFSRLVEYCDQLIKE